MSDKVHISFDQDWLKVRCSDNSSNTTLKIGYALSEGEVGGSVSAVFTIAPLYKSLRNFNAEFTEITFYQTTNFVLFYQKDINVRMRTLSLNVSDRTAFKVRNFNGDLRIDKRVAKLERISPYFESMVMSYTLNTLKFKFINRNRDNYEVSFEKGDGFDCNICQTEFSILFNSKPFLRILPRMIGVDATISLVDRNIIVIGYVQEGVQYEYYIKPRII